MKITSKNNFCRVFEVSKKYPCGFLMVAWFHPIPQSVISADPEKDWSDKDWNRYVDMSLIPFIKRKRYYDPNKTYKVTTSFKKSFMIPRSENK